MSSILRVGLTGGIGSGKSTIAQIFEVLGIPVSYADREAKRLMNEDAELRDGRSSLNSAPKPTTPGPVYSTDPGWRRRSSPIPPDWKS